MKKTLVKSVIAICVLAVGFIAGTKVYEKHNEQINDMKNTYESQIRELESINSLLAFEKNDLEDRVSELEDGIYKVMNHEAYFIAINHDDTVLVYESDGSLFGQKTYGAMK